MISVTVYKDKNNHYTGFRCDGHAEYAEPGEDIVCSAVSVLTLNTSTDRRCIQRRSRSGNRVG